VQRDAGRAWFRVVGRSVGGRWAKGKVKQRCRRLMVVVVVEQGERKDGGVLALWI
jgi:hypothetical protein